MSTSVLGKGRRYSLVVTRRTTCRSSWQTSTQRAEAARKADDSRVRGLHARNHAEPPDPLEVAWLHDLRVLDPRTHLRHVGVRSEPEQARQRLARQNVLEDVQHNLVRAVPDAVDVLRRRGRASVNRAEL
jgi:hypothetical protein